MGKIKPHDLSPPTPGPPPWLLHFVTHFRVAVSNVELAYDYDLRDLDEKGRLGSLASLSLGVASMALGPVDAGAASSLRIGGFQIALQALGEWVHG